MPACPDYARSDASNSHTQDAPIFSHSITAATEVANSWLLPDGVNDVLFHDAYKQETLRYQLIQRLVGFGYQQVSPPVIEFTESLLNNASEDLKRQTFKIIDQLTGRLMGVRADITPQILRIDSQQGGGAIARYCYAGHVVHTLPSGLFGSRTPLQLGAEIFGCGDIAADIELVDVLFDLINSLQLDATLHIDLGHVAVFERLCDLAQLTDADTERLMHLYANKALPELKHVCASLPMGSDFYYLARFGHDVDALMGKLSASARTDEHIVAAVAQLKQLHQHLLDTHRCQVSIDMTELSGYHYHTGLVFNGYVNNESLPLLRGGRFAGHGISHSNPSNHSDDGDSDSHSDGQNGTAANGNTRDDSSVRSATGFSMDVTRLLRHVSISRPKLVRVDYQQYMDASDAERQALFERVQQLRHEGHQVVLPLTATDALSAADVHLRLSDGSDGQWQLTEL